MKKNYLQVLMLVISLMCLTFLSSCGGGGGRGKTPSSNELPSSNPEWIQGVKATVMEYSGMIKLTWTPRTERNVTYKVYRYESKATDAEMAEFPNIQENEIDDTPEVDIPYYYRVTWVKDTIEYGEDAPLVVGLCRADVDPFEPNDDLTQAQKLTPGMTVDDTYTFIFDDGVSGSTVDRDWYYCENTSDTAIKITIELIEAPNDMRIFCQEQELIDEILLTVEPGTMYFKIEPISGEGFGKYRITITD